MEHSKESIFGRQLIPEGRIPTGVIFKWDYEVLCEGFVPFPKRLLRCLAKVLPPEMDWNHLAVLLAVIDYRRPSVSRFPSIEFLGFLSGLSASEVQTCLRDLEAAGLIELKHLADGVDVGIAKLLAKIKAAAPVDI